MLFYRSELEGGIPLTLYNRGLITLLFGVILLILSIFFTIDWGFETWMALFSVSLILCTLGIIMLITHLVKQIKADKQKKL